MSLEEKKRIKTEENSPVAKPESQVKTIVQELQMMTTKRGQLSNSLDFNSLEKEQKDKIINILQSNEENAFNFHIKRLDTLKEIHKEEIHSSNTNNKTVRYSILLSILLFGTITILILFFKEAYFDKWLSFLIGLLGGTGIGSFLSGFKNKDKPNIKEIIDRESE